MGVSNQNSLRGLLPVDDQDDGMHANMKEYGVAAALGVNIFVGQLVGLSAALGGTAGGAPMPAPSTGPGGGASPASDMQAILSGQYAYIQPHVAGNTGPVLGVVNGFLYDPERQKEGLKYLPAGQAGNARLITDPRALFYCVAAAPITMAQAGLNIDIVVGTPNTAYGWPAIQLDPTTIATTATLPLRLVEPAKLIGNDITLNYAVWMVRLNNSEAIIQLGE